MLVDIPRPLAAPAAASIPDTPKADPSLKGRSCHWVMLPSRWPVTSCDRVRKSEWSDSNRHKNGVGFIFGIGLICFYVIWLIMMLRTDYLVEYGIVVLAIV